MSSYLDAFCSRSICPSDFFFGSGGGAPNPFACSWVADDDGKDDDEEEEEVESYGLDEVIVTADDGAATKACAAVEAITKTAKAANLVEGFIVSSFTGTLG
jgi:hypothetical protein